MGLLGRINTVIKSNVNDLVDRMTDPGKEIELLIVEMENNVKQARQEVVSVAAGAKRAHQRCEELTREVENWQRRAEQAVRAGDDQLAREALRERQARELEAAAARQGEAEQQAYVEELTRSLKALEVRLQEVKARKETLKARARAAKQGRDDLQPGKAFEDFNRLEDRIGAIEAEAELGESLEAREAATEAKFDRLEGGDPKVEDALAALKRKLSEEP